MPASYCLVPRCPEMAAVRGRCPQHAKALDKSLKSKPASQRHIYTTKRWKTMRRQVLSEQRWCATLGCPNLATQVDHIVPVAQGGASFDRSNLQGLCPRCHARKTARETWHFKGDR